MAWGILLGLAAALAQSASYFCTRLFVVRRHRGVLRLLVLGHLIMGVVSAGALPLLWSDRIPPLARFAWPLVGTAMFYLLGQLGLFIALERTDASRTGPMLGLKIVVLAAITAGVLGIRYGVPQWLAVALAVAAAFVLNAAGGAIPGKALTAILLACVSYSLSDLHIKWLVDSLRTDGLTLMPASLLAVAMTYVLCGLAGAAMLPLAGRGTLGEWRYAVPFAASWLAAMVFLFACFAAVGVVYGNILQSTRGLMTVLIGARIAQLGHEHIERRLPVGVLVRRIVAAAMMVVAIALFQIGRG